jgi:GntR family transcriptional regulator
MDGDGALIRFRLDPRTGVPAYRQLIDQVRHAIRTGLLSPGDQIPSVRQVVGQISINPNTVHRAYRDLEGAGVIEGRPGLGTFVTDSAVPPTSPGDQQELHDSLVGWVRSARRAGVDDDGLRGLLAAALRELDDEGGPTQ